MSKKNMLNYLSPIGREIPVMVADTFLSRLTGLMGKKEGNYGLLLTPCNAIHTFFMRYPLDALYLDHQNRVLAIKRCIKTFSLVPGVKGATKVVEFPSSLNALAFLEVGAEVKFY